MNLKKGDMVWVKIKGPQQDYGFGEVEEVWVEEKKELFTFYCLVNGGLRIGIYSNIIPKPTTRMVAKLSAERSAVKAVLNKK